MATSIPSYIVAGGRLTGIRNIADKAVAFRYAARHGCWIEEIPTAEFGTRWTNREIRAQLAAARGT